MKVGLKHRDNDRSHQEQDREALQTIVDSLATLLPLNLLSDDIC